MSRPRSAPFRGVVAALTGLCVGHPGGRLQFGQQQHRVVHDHRGLVVGCGEFSASVPSSRRRRVRRRPLRRAPPPRRRRRAAGTLTVFAAASLKATFTEIGTIFQTENPGSTVTFNFAGSSDLVTQLTAGAPADVFASADTNNMTKATDREPGVAGRR